ncbi:restriction endonuclease subunit S [Stutzerimonas nitrititolerans]|uniref:restriction endonuclease subunit S n=1 Tax=Stutzerimonas nitrititolerans TaxID=2482751 RepID=UPI002649E8CF|nr:restriction endonuclease subunit S [Stutzerimonas nitrititolerans]
MTFPAYPNYKSTGVEWLSEIPVHWELIRLRFLLLDGAEGIKIGPFGSQLTSDMLVEIGYKVYGQENVIAGDFDKGQRYITDEKFSEMSVYEISPNDLLVTMMGTAGRCKVVPEAISAGVMDSHLLRMRFGRKADPKFVELLIDKSIYVSHQVRLNGKGSIMHGLNSSIIKELLVALPSADEQASILSFLDHEIARIDALIEEQQRLIELLKEKRQAVISHAVTKGLDPTVPMKDSGVEWLGEVPAHWGVVSMSRIFEIRAGGDLKTEFYSDVRTEFHKYPIFTNATSESAIYGYTSKPIFSGGTITVTGRGGVGYAIYRTEPYDAIIRLLVLRPMRDVHAKFYAYFINAVLTFSVGSSAISQLSAEQIAPYKVLLPPLSEQVEILALLDQATMAIDTLINEAHGVISLLQERRSALISAAVTGKIDVRGWQPPVSTQAPKFEVAEAV